MNQFRTAVEDLADRRLVSDLSGGEVSLHEAGGKGAALTRLLAGRLPAPPGFLLTTEAYRRAVEQGGLGEAIEAVLAETAVRSETATPADAAGLPDRWERVSARVQAAFLAASMPSAVADSVREAYARLSAEAGQPDTLPVAVRSSATAEDLPGASFAGQQETFLNVVGADAVLEAVRRCWASLWTARALAYRERLGVVHGGVAMAVVVQRLLPAEVAGVLFTANPTTGARDEILVNASYGLGEAVVSGQVTPDTFVLGRDDGAIRSTTLGTKSEMVVARADRESGTSAVPVPEDRRRVAALGPDRLRELAALGLRVERLAGGTPQDVEWAVAEGQLWLLQARPITGLPPAPLKNVRWEPPTPGSRWIRRQVVEHMPEPLSPLFDELYLSGGLERSGDIVMAALEIPGGLDDLIDRPMFATINGFAYQRADVHLNWRMAWMLLHTTVRGLAGLFRNGVRNWRDTELPLYEATVVRWKALDPADLTDARLLAGIRELADADARYWFAAALAIGAAKVSDGLLDWYLRQAAPGRQLSSGIFLRGLSARGLAAERSLEGVADLVHRSEALRRLVRETPPDRLLEALAAHPAGRPAREALDRYFDQFGHLIYSLDFAVPTQVDDPLPVLISLRALAERPGRDSEAEQAVLSRQRDRLTRQTDRAFDPFRRRLFRNLLRWAASYAPYREEALFYVGYAWPTLRRLAHELGRRLTARGALAGPDDIYYLRSEEVASAIGLAPLTPRPALPYAGEGESDGSDVAGPPTTASHAPESMDTTHALARVAMERRELREARKRLQPPAAVPPAYRFMLGPIDLSSRESLRRNDTTSDILSGFAVSPGRVTAPASVILSPADFGRMQPGTVLVCPTTTPAWTPLFSQARALVTDIGGVLAHGSIVAREYGIPAVMGTGIATQRIEQGQTITVDGDAGAVTLGGRHHPV
ncbi:MAG: phosphoenolpyruvate synthase [Chloroflexi bacterium]|nr:phosphoenolpyruvate synthase [Chloroflexota bacterium]